VAIKVGFIGLGGMGKALSTNLARAGFDLMVYDVREEPLKELAALGAKIARSAKEVGEFAEIVEVAVVDDAQVEEVILGNGGILAGAKPGTAIIVHSTIHPRTVKKVAAAAKAQGVGVLDAQMSGGETGVKARTLCFMVGGERELFEKCRPVLAASGKDIFHVGEVGMGAAAKLAQQTLICLNRLAAYEGMLLAGKAGVDLQVFQKIVHVTSAQSRIADNWSEQYKDMKDLDPEAARWRAHLFYKGLCPALEFAHELGVSVPGAALVQQVFDRVLGLKE
jgi:3-hydroxyisobutyrate dehydrogenase-like beta-hydroxyacid dehydrogenase